jgi:hypothetical protein
MLYIKPYTKYKFGTIFYILLYSHLKIQCNFYQNLARVFKIDVCIHGINLILFYNREVYFSNIFKTRRSDAHLHQICSPSQNLSPGERTVLNSRPRPHVKFITPTTANTNVLTHNLEATDNTSAQKINTRAQLETPMAQPDITD